MKLKIELRQYFFRAVALIAGETPICAKLSCKLLKEKWQTVSAFYLFEFSEGRKQMQSPPRESDTRFEKLLQDLPEGLEESAREFKAFTRSRKLKSVQDLMRAVLLYSGLDQSLREVAGTMTLHLGESISDNAIRERLEGAKPWLKVLLQKMLDLRQELNLDLQGRRLLVVDASHVTGPDAKGTEFRIHVKMDLLSFDLLEVLVMDSKTSESLVNFHYEAGDIVIGDRAYIRRRRVFDAVREGVDVIGRFSPTQCVVVDAKGDKIEWERMLLAMARGERKTMEVYLDDGKRRRVRAWVHILRKDEKSSCESRRKARRKAQQDGRTARALTLFLCEYVMVLSTVSEEALRRELVLKLYRVRWQIELCFKRWKSLLGVSRQRCKRLSELGWSWLYGKLLYAILVERLSGRRLGLEKSISGRRQSLWRIWKLVKEELSVLITGRLFWRTDMWDDAIRVLGERRRRRRLQTVDEEVLAFLRRG